MCNKIILKTERLFLRELNFNDLDDLCVYLSDPETMSHYPEQYSREMVKKFIQNNIDRYSEIGCGLWAIILKSEEKLIGDCGITIQDIDGVDEHEIGYHLNKDYWGNGYATEAAQAVKDYGFDTLNLNKLCSYMAEDHTASRRVAERNRMTLEKTFNNPRNRNLPTVVFSINKDDNYACIT